MIDTRGYFRPLVTDFGNFLTTLAPQDWDLPTVAGRWRVRDVVAHLTDTAVRRLSFQRDGHVASPPPSTVPFVAFINGLNADWVNAMQRVSPRVLVDLYRYAATDVAAWMESLPLDEPPLFPVSWAGEDGTQGWLDIGRDFTEQWHHQMQVREAVGRPLDGHPEWLRALLVVALAGLPHAYHDVTAPASTALQLSITGAAGGEWVLRKNAVRWTLHVGVAEHPAAHAVISDDRAWRLLFNALPADAARTAITFEGDPALLEPLLQARSVIV